MFGRLFLFLLICHCLQDVAVEGGYHDEWTAIIGGDKQLDSDQRTLEESQWEQAAKKDPHSTITMTRHRRHIGSVAAFRGLPEKVVLPNWRNGKLQAMSDATNRNADRVNPYDQIGSTLDGPDSVTSNDEIVMIVENPDEEIGKDKRYPTVQPGGQPLQITEPELSLARMMAMDRLLRLMSKAKANSKTKFYYKVKKHLGALARNNAVPLKTRTSSVPNKGARVNSLPSKKTLFRVGHNEVLLDEQAEEYDKLLSGTQDDFFDVYTDYTDNDLKGQMRVWYPPNVI